MSRQSYTLFSVALLAAFAVACDDKSDFDPPPQKPQIPVAAKDPVKPPAPVQPAATPVNPPAINPPAAPPATDTPKEGTKEAAKDDADAPLNPSTHPSLFVRSSRCGECHEKIHVDWEQSAHMRASRSAAYRKGLESAGPTFRALCQSCHLPSQAAGQPDEQPGRPSEGVACDGCHTLSAVAVAKNQATMTFDPGSGKKYGPIVGATGHYFHDMAYSPLHTKADVCAGCHHLSSVRVNGQLQNIPVVSNYSEWKLYGKGKMCQDCHMPSRGTEPVAKGAKPRPNVPAHVFAGAPVQGKQMRLEFAPKGKPGEVTVELQHSAGHLVPSGFVERRLIVRAEFFGHDGAKAGTVENSFGIKLVDAEGKPAPFFKAVKVAEDRRMVPGKLYFESFPIPAAPIGGGALARVTVTLLAAPTAPELSAFYGEPEFVTLKSISSALPVRPGGR